jgi:prephenate dehydrogenase
METVAILGYGRFGSALGQLFAEAGIAHRAYDVGSAPAALAALGTRARSVRELVEGAGYVILAVPVERMREALLELRPHIQGSNLRPIVLDVGSVKVHPAAALDEVLGDTLPWVATHPLFGPISLALAERPLRVVVCPARAHPEAAERVRGLYERIGCEVIEQTPESHDRVMAHTHALTFFVAKGMIDAGAGMEVPFAPPSFQAMARAIDAVRSDAGHLFSAIARDNPFARDARKELVTALFAIDQAFDAEEASSEGASPDAGRAFAIPDLGERSPELKQTREHIDAVDREIVRLLGRRTQLARRAADAKVKLGAPVLDPAREAEVMRARRDWAAEMKLDPDAIANVFLDIIKMARRAQRG